MAISDQDKKALAQVKGRRKRLTEVAKRRREKAWRRSYKNGDDERIKSDAGELAGRIYVKALELLETVEDEGIVLRSPKTDVHGNAVTSVGPDGVRDYVWEVKVHPALEAVLKLAKMLHVDPSEFGLTPQSTGHGPGAIQGGIEATQINIEQVTIEAERSIADFKKALKLAAQLREGDPVYQEFAQLQEARKDG